MKTSTEYWSEHMVSVPEQWDSRQASLEHFHWRNAQYIDYLKCMPVNTGDGKVVIDYGCGPGNDMVGFREYSNPRRLIGIDVSATAIATAQERLTLHKDTGPVEFIHVMEEQNDIPLEDKSVDYIHCSGVLHHCKEPEKVLQEFRRILKDDGEIAIMVYNYDSLHLHLHTAWMQPVVNQRFVGLSLAEAFRQNTDGFECPISRCFKPSEFQDYGNAAGFKTEFVGAAVSMMEMQILRHRFEAIKHRGLAREHRDFLLSLTFDERGVPFFNGHVAGIDGCFRMTKV